MRARRHRNDRQGVVLLIILGLMAMFGMVVLAFVLVTGHSKSEAVGLQRGQEYTIIPQEQLHSAVMQALRGDASAASCLRQHGLLEDMYGAWTEYGDMVSGVTIFDPPNPVTLTTSICSGQLIAFTPAYENTEIATGNKAYHLHGNPYRFVGRVLTMKSGPAAGKSTRIVGYDAANNLLLILPFANVASAVFVADVQSIGGANNGSRGYIINGTAFSGTGFGYNSGTGRLNAPLWIPASVPPDPITPLALAIGPLPEALLPNRTGDPSNTLTKGLHGDGGANEEYDAVDYQDMLLAAMMPDGTVFIPSLHRPALIHWWYYRIVKDWLVAVKGLTLENAWKAVLQPVFEQRSGNIDLVTRDAIIALKRRILFRPLPDLHGGFTGGNLASVQDYSQWTLGEDKNGNGRLDPAEDLNGNGAIDPAEDLNGNGVLDPGEDTNGNGLLDPSEDVNGNGVLDPSEDTNGNGMLDGEDTNGNGVLDPGEDVNGNGRLDPPISVGYWERTGPWDVDCNGDGKPDAIWVDLGFPVREMPDGRRYKPLFAILCVDMDGRLNVNADGCLAQALQDSSGQGVYNAPVDGSPFVFAGGTAAALARGQGYGTAEVSLLPVVDGNYDQYRKLLVGGVDPTCRTRWVEGRYGEARGLDLYSLDSNGDGLPDTGPPDGVPDDFRDMAPGDSYGPQDGLADNWRDNAQVLRAADPLSRNQLFEFAGLTSFSLGNPSAFGTPADLKGSMAIGLDLRGQPIYRPLVDPAVNSAVDANGDGSVDWYDWFAWMGVNIPYELNLSRESARAPSTDCWRPGVAGASRIDHPFTVYEMERLLRRFDRDGGGLADRLELLAPKLAFNHFNEVTTEGWHVPAPSLTLPREMVVPDRPGADPRALPLHCFGDLLRLKGVSSRYWVDLVGRELLAGLPLNVNRPLGNGVDDNANGVVDEPGRVIRDPGNPAQFILDPAVPSEVGEFLAAVDANGNAVPNVPFDHTNGIDVNGDGVLNSADQAMGRQLLARHLFVLAMLLRDAGYEIPMTPNTEDATNYPPGSPESKELTVRRIAQWAVNVVDFRDADATMTPFEYDPNPFVDDDPADADGDGVGNNDNPWNVDGVIDINPGVPGSDDGAPWRRLVWGCESPELLLSGTLAFHDRRVADTKGDSGGHWYDEDGDGTIDPGEDDDYDQPRIPEGSAFFELYCARNRNNPAAPGDLYSRDANGRWYVDLDRMAPPRAAGDGQPAQLPYPVWRMAISEPAQGTTSSPAADVDRDGAPDNSVRRRVQQNAVTGQMRPDSASLEPEQTAATAPGSVPSEFSLLRGVTVSAVANVQLERIVWLAAQAPSGQEDDAKRIYWRQAGSSQVYPGEYLVVGPRQRTIIGSVFDASGKLGQPSPQHIDLGPMDVTDVTGASNYPTYHDPPDTSADQIKAPRSMVVAGGAPTGWPADSRIGLSISEPLWSSADYYPLPTNLTTGEYGDLDTPPATAPFYKDAPLDSEDGKNRPLEPFLEDKDPNDVGKVPNFSLLDYKTVFLQRLADPSAPYDAVRNPYCTVDWMPIDLTVFNGERGHESPMGDDPVQKVRFAMRERGLTSGPGGADFNLWSQETDDPAETRVTPTGNNVFSHNLLQTLGYINRAFQGSGWWTFADGVPAEYFGDPKSPFPWLTWNDRPYANQVELLQVPASHPARLMFEYSLANTTAEPYADATDPADPRLKTGFLPWGHLPNYLHSSSSAAPGSQSPHFYRVLDYLNVPSRFVGTETLFSPTVFGDYSDPNTRPFRPPFNRVSEYREPGRVNINTIFSPNVWTGLTGLNSPAYYADMVNSRRGYAPTAEGLNENYPTQFANPFRSFAGSYLVPTPELAEQVVGEEVNATFLRRQPPPGSPDVPLFRHVSSYPFDEPSRNPYFAYQLLQRLAGSTTTRSNVYAVWITVGYFEVLEAPDIRVTGWSPAVQQAVYPEGYQLGAELGSDTGDITRHRAFYLFDRSIPVGFERGRDNNVEDAILLERFIE